MDSGANGYLLKSTDPEEIKQGIMDVMRTGFYLNNFVNRVLIKKNYAKQKFNPNLNSEVVISEREKEVLSLVCMEYTAQEIAQKMDISARTVEAIKDRLMERFGVKNSVGLVFFVTRRRHALHRRPAGRSKAPRSGAGPRLPRPHRHRAQLLLPPRQVGHVLRSSQRRRA